MFKSGEVLNFADMNLTPHRLDNRESRPPLRIRRGDGGEVLAQRLGSRRQKNS